MAWNAVIYYCVYITDKYALINVFVAELDQHILNFTAT